MAYARSSNACFLFTCTVAALTPASIVTAYFVFAGRLTDAATVDADVLRIRAQPTSAITAVRSAFLATAGWLALARPVDAQVLHSQATSARPTTTVAPTPLAGAVRVAVVALAVGATVRAIQSFGPHFAAAINPADIPVTTIGVVFWNTDAITTLACFPT